MPQNRLVDPAELEAQVVAQEIRERYRIEQANRPRTPDWEPQSWQLAPEDYILGDTYVDENGQPKSWWCWVLLGGRGIGKTRTGAQQTIEHLREYGASARVGVGAPTIGDAREVCAEGESGLITKFGKEFPVYNRSTLEAWHIRGGYVKFQGSEEPKRWNGPQWSFLWADELALWVEESWIQAQFGLRLGVNPRAFASTTPKNRKFVKELLEEPGVVKTHASSDQNKHISARMLERLYRRYGDSRIGLQELQGEFLPDLEGAMWKREWFDKWRILRQEDLPTIIRIVVAVDPNGGDSDKSADTGIAVVGKDSKGHFYVFVAEGLRLSPHGWANRAAGYYRKFSADALIAEKNYGGTMVSATFEAAAPDVPVRVVTASRGKDIRAEPIATLYEQGRVHHVGNLTEVEAQMTQFPVEKKAKKDVLDAVVWAITDLNDADWDPLESEFSGQPEGAAKLLARQYPLTGNSRTIGLDSVVGGRITVQDPYDALVRGGWQ